MKSTRQVRSGERSRERSRHDPGQVELLRVFLSFLLLLQALSGFFPGPLLWGVNHLAYAPLAFRVLWPLFGILLVWTRAGSSIGRWLINRVAPTLLGGRFVAYVAAPVVGALLFWLLRCKTYFLGDGWLLGEMVAAGIRFHGFNFVHYHLVARLFGTLTHPVEADAFRLFAWTSIVAGAIYLLAAAWSARNLSNDDGERVLLYSLLVFFAPVEMFMGYVECYSILMVFLLFFLAAIAMHYTRGRPAWIAAAAFGMALAFHLDALFLAPLLLALAFWPGRRVPRSVLKRLVTLKLPILAAMAFAVGFYLLDGYDRSSFVNDFVKSRQAQRLLVTLSGPNGFLSWRHTKDILNLLLLVAPVPLAMLAAAATRRKRVEVVSTNPAPTGPSGSEDSRRRAVVVFLSGSLWLFLLLSVVHMKLGIARDWDLFAAQTPVFVLAAYLAWSTLTRGRPGPRLVGITVTAAVFLVVPWFWLNAGEARSVQRFGDMITDQPGFSQAYAHDEMGKYYRKRGMIKEALDQYRTAAELFPENARFSVVLGGLQYNNGMRDDALRSFERALRADSTFVLALKMAARIHAERGELEQALVYARRLSGSPKEDPDAAALHGAVAEKLGLYDEALRAYESAVEKDSGRADLTGRIRALREKSRTGLRGQ